LKNFTLALGLLLFFVVAFSAQAAPRTASNAAWNVNVEGNGSDPSKYRGEWPGHNYFPSPRDWRNVAVYQFITDRFRDGDPTNNEKRYPGYNLYDVSARHGGDFRGVKESLNYIKSLGFDGIWISPVFQNRYNSYHGYAQIDFTVLDERFGTLQEMREMVDEAHRLGMYVIVDIIVNHMDNLLMFKDHPNGAPFRLHDGEYELAWRNENEQYEDFKFNNHLYGDGGSSYCDVYGDDGQPHSDPGKGKASYWDSDFHHNGDLGSYGDPWQNHLGKIYGAMDDLRTTHPRTRGKIIAMTKALISSTDVDGIRMDTPMQVPLEFFKEWAPAVKNHARSLGKDNFFIFGEFYCGRERAATMVGRGRRPDQWGQPFSFIDDRYSMDAGINYRFYYDFVASAIKAQTGGAGNAMDVFKQDFKAYDFYNPLTRDTRYTMLNFINNHDQWRLNWENDGFQKTMLGSAVIAFWPGMPLYYYGDEQGFATEGSAVDGPSREDFMTSKAWWDRASKSSPNPAVFDNFNMTHSHYLYVQKAMNIRRQYSALRETDEIYERWVQKDNTNGIYAFTRVWGDQKNWVFVAFNTWRERLEAGGGNGDLWTGWNEGSRIVNVMNPDERYTLGPGGKLNSLWLNGYETKVFVREDGFQPRIPVVEQVEPSHDAVVEQGNREVVLRFSERMRSETVEGAVTYDGVNVQPRSDDGYTYRFQVPVSAGVHKVRVSNQARSHGDRSLVAEFSSRFRAGEQSNPIVKLQKDALDDGSLYSVSGPGRDGERTLSFQHKAAGAQMYRVSTDDGKSWGDWQSYSERTETRVKPQGQRLEVLVQYWVDGSAAYLVKKVTDL